MQIVNKGSYSHTGLALGDDKSHKKEADFEKKQIIFSTFISPRVSRDRLKKAGASMVTLNTNRKMCSAEKPT